VTFIRSRGTLERLHHAVLVNLCCFDSIDDSVLTSQTDETSLESKYRGMCEVAIQHIACGIVLHGDQVGWHRNGVNMSSEGVNRVGSVDEVLGAVHDIVNESNGHAS
jgi:hypothetical protein